MYHVCEGGSISFVRPKGPKDCWRSSRRVNSWAATIRRCNFLFIFEARQKTGLPIRKTIGRKAELLREGFGLAWEAIQQPIADYVKSQIICDFTLGPLAGLKSL
jgi:hypothetical protein